MDWVYINTGLNTGEYNMNFDLDLAKNFDENIAVFRLYRWKPYCISLGANQSIKSINQEISCRNNIDIVTRPTGGRAVLHSEELTYSVIYPLDFTSSARAIYHNINLALLEGLKIYDFVLSEIELEDQQPKFTSIYKLESNIACFAVSAKSELQCRGKKLVGSAQRKKERVILQHGSILCGDYHKKITEFLEGDDLMISEIKNEIQEHTIDLCQITSREVDYNYLAECLREGFEKFHNMKFMRSDYIGSLT